MSGVNWNTIVDDPDCSQMIRDFARTKLAEQNAEGEDRPQYKMDLDPIWVEVIETNEMCGSVIGDYNILPDASLVQIATSVLLHDENSDGCTSVKAINNPDGTSDVLSAYPKLVSTCWRIIHDNSSTSTSKSGGSRNVKDLKADAYIVLACLCQMQNGRSYQEEEGHFKKAISLRPDDWRIHGMLGITYIRHDQVALSLECVTRAVELAKTPKAKFDLLQKKGKLLSNLMRPEDAIVCLEQAISEYERMKDTMTPKDKGHAAVSQYALCYNYYMSRDNKSSKKKYMQKAMHHWKEAEAKRSELPADIMDLMSWGFRDTAQMLVAMIKPDAALSHRECHYCHKVTDDAKKCSACKVAVYCSRECQAKAWKAGHKKECVKKNAERKVEKKGLLKKVGGMGGPPQTIMDEHLIPKDIWKKGLKMMKKGKKDEAVWNLLVALFMDFSLDSYSNQPILKKVVDQYNITEEPDKDLETDDGKFLALVLSMVTHYGNKHPVQYCTEILDILETKIEPLTLGINSNAAKLDDVNRRGFAFGVAQVFRGRWLNRMYDMSRGPDPKKSKEAFEDAARCISKARLFLDPDQWLTYQYELGYSHFDIMAVDEGKTWLKRFVDTLKESEKKAPLSVHWKSAKRAAEQKLAMIPMMENARKQFGGTFPF